MSLEIPSYKEVENLSPEVKEYYSKYAQITWNSICAMTYDNTGLPADQLHHPPLDNHSTQEISRIDKTSPTNIGFLLASIGAAYAMNFISQEETHDSLDRTLTTLINMTENPEIFFETSQGKGLFVNWIQPSTAKVLKQWPDTNAEVKKQISTVDMAWLITFCKMIGVQFPEHSQTINTFLDKMDLPFMFNPSTGFFNGCFNIKENCFEPWQYDVLSEARIAYLVCDDDICIQMSNIINKRTERSIFKSAKQKKGRCTWSGEYFSMGWPLIIVPEDWLSSQWEETIKVTIEMQKQFGEEYNNGYYGYSAGLGPDGKYYEYRVPNTGESTDPYTPQPVVTISALVNMGIISPKDTYDALKRIHCEFPNLTHPEFGDGDTVNTLTGEIQRDQIFPNQAVSLLSCWNILREQEPRKIFLNVLPTSAISVYQQNML